MSRVSTYLNFDGQTEEAFRFYAEVFGTAIGTMSRMRDVGASPGEDGLQEGDLDLIAHAEMTILAGHVIMGTDMVESLGQYRRIGNNTTINLEVDDRDEADRLYQALSEGGSESTGLADMPWAYWGCTLDRYGIRWMLNCYHQAG